MQSGGRHPPPGRHPRGASAPSPAGSWTGSSRPRSRKRCSICWPGPRATSASRKERPARRRSRPPVRSPTEALLMEGARRLDEWSRIGSKVSHLGLVPAAAGSRTGAGAPLDLVPFEWEVLAAVDGQRDLHALAEVLGRSEFEVARTVYGLTAAGVVVLGDPARPGPGAGAGPGSRPRCWCRRARRWRRESTRSPPGRWRRCSGAIRSCPRRGGCSASARPPWAGSPQALETWHAWSRLGPRTPGRGGRGPGGGADAARGGNLVKELERLSVTDDIRTLTTRLAEEPASLAFLELAEALRRRGQLEAAGKVARGGLVAVSRARRRARSHGPHPQRPGRPRRRVRRVGRRASSRPDAHRRAQGHRLPLFPRRATPTAAIEHLQRAAEADPDDDRIAQALARVRRESRTDAVTRPGRSRRRSRSRRPTRHRSPAPLAAPSRRVDPAPIRSPADDPGSPFAELDGGPLTGPGGRQRAPAGREVSPRRAATRPATGSPRSSPASPARPRAPPGSSGSGPGRPSRSSRPTRTSSWSGPPARPCCSPRGSRRCRWPASRCWRSGPRARRSSWLERVQ